MNKPIGIVMSVFLVVLTCVLFFTLKPSDIDVSAQNKVINLVELPLVVPNSKKEKPKPKIIENPEKELPELLKNSIPAEELRWLFRVTMSEGSILPFEGKVKIVITVLDRVDDPDYPDNIIDVILQENQFSVADNGRPNKECMEAVKYALNHRDEYPKDMLWFSSDMVHSYGYYYCTEGNTNFNTKTDHLK